MHAAGLYADFRIGGFLGVGARGSGSRMRGDPALDDIPKENAAGLKSPSLI
jgi:hypothetical protein